MKYKITVTSIKHSVSGTWKLPGSWIPFTGMAAEYTVCIFLPPKNQFLWLNAFVFHHVFPSQFCDSVLGNLDSICGIFIRFMKVSDTKPGGSGEWFSSRKNKTGKDFLCLLIFSWALVFRSQYLALEAILKFITHKGSFWHICLTILK